MADAQDKEQLDIQHPEEGQDAAGEATEGASEEAKPGRFTQPGPSRLSTCLPSPNLTDFLPGTSFGLGGYGNSVGDKIESTMAPVGKPLGKGLETVGRPLGGVIDPIVGGIMRFGSASGAAAGVGAGNMDKKNEAEAEWKKESIGGKEQTRENPLGL